jgi:hypothetical protein
MDGEGARPDALDEARRKHKPKTVYLVPTQQNPTTATMSPPRRKAVADVLRKRGIVLIEDDVYGPLEPSLFADRQSNPRSDVLRGQHRQEHRAGAARRLFPCAQLRSRAEDAGGSTGQDADACFAHGRAAHASAPFRYRQRDHPGDSERGRRAAATGGAIPERNFVRRTAGQPLSLAAAAGASCGGGPAAAPGPQRPGGRGRRRLRDGRRSTTGLRVSLERRETAPN